MRRATSLLPPAGGDTSPGRVRLALLGLAAFGLAGALTASGQEPGRPDAPLAAFVVAGVEPRAADLDAPLGAGWPAATRPGRIEVKQYPAYRSAVARGKEAAAGADRALFYPLFLHITRSQVAMTAPVISTYEAKAVGNAGATGDVAMEFVYPTTTTGQTGRGLGAVVVEDRPAGSFVCLGVQGGDDPKRLAAAVTALQDWLAAHRSEWVAAGDPRRLGYHPPMVDEAKRLWEVQIPIKRVEPTPPGPVVPPAQPADPAQPARAPSPEADRPSPASSPGDSRGDL